MKTMLHKILIPCFTLIVLTSCDPAKEFEAELKVIDSCMAELNKIDSLYNGIEFDSLHYMVSHVKRNEGLMKDYYSSDTIDQALGMLMNNSKGIRKSLKNIDGAKQDFADEIAALRTQFDHLGADIRNGIYDKEQIAGFLAKEKEALNKLNLSFMDFYNNQKLQSQTFYSTVPKVDEYVKRLDIPVEDTLQ